MVPPRSCRLPLAIAASAAGLALSCPAAQAQSPPPKFCSGVETSELSAPSVFRYGLSPGELEAKFLSPATGLSGQGFSARRLTGYRSGDSMKFATRWVKAPAPHTIARSGLTGSQFHALYASLKARYRPIDVSGYNDPHGATRFAAIWERNEHGVDWKVQRDVSRAGMQQLVDASQRTGWTPLRVEGYRRAGKLNFVSIWVKTPCNWKMHNKLTRAQYQAKLDAYKATRRLVHLDSYQDGGTTYFAGIWLKQPGPSQTVRSDRHWYRFQRHLNNNRCNGYALENFYAAEAPGGVRYGGIWTAGPVAGVGPSSPLNAQVDREVDCAPARTGAAVIDLNTGQEALAHADVQYGTASTIKSSVVYAVLRRLDATPATLASKLAITSENDSDNLAAGTSYSIDTLATLMISKSDNGATNRLIKYVGMAKVNQELANLGFGAIRVNRYMRGGLSVHGNAGATADYEEGWDNLATPRQYARFLRRVHLNAGLLSPASSAYFWSRLALNGGAHSSTLTAGVGAGIASVFEKAGSNGWPSAPATKPQIGAHVQRSAAGRLVLSNGHVVFYAIFADEGDETGADALNRTVSCVVTHAARAFSGANTGTDLANCQGG